MNYFSHNANWRGGTPGLMVLLYEDLSVQAFVVRNNRIVGIHWFAHIMETIRCEALPKQDLAEIFRQLEAEGILS